MILNINFIKRSWVYNRLKSVYFTKLLPAEQIPNVSNYHLDWYPQFADIGSLIESVLSKPDIKFIQIGSNDGITGDPFYMYINRYKWRGVLIEPVYYNFTRLKETHGKNSNLELIHAAVGSKSGMQTFYSMLEIDLIDKPIWYDQLGSFNREVILSHKKFFPNIENYIKEIQVQVLTVSEIYNLYQLGHVNLIHIDTEGYDYEILKSINLNNDQPEFILFEYKHLNIKDYKAALDKLRKYNYQFVRTYQDTLAYLPSVDLSSILPK